MRTCTAKESVAALASGSPGLGHPVHTNGESERLVEPSAQGASITGGPTWCPLHCVPPHGVPPVVRTICTPFKAARWAARAAATAAFASAPTGAPAAAGQTPVGWREKRKTRAAKRPSAFTRSSSTDAASWLPLHHCPGRAEPVKSAFGVGFADLRLLTEPARSPGVRSYREQGEDRAGSKEPLTTRPNAVHQTSAVILGRLAHRP